MKVTGAVLIVAPLSTLGNWVRELARFAPSLPTTLYHGSIPERASLRNAFTDASVAFQHTHPALPSPFIPCGGALLTQLQLCCPLLLLLLLPSDRCDILRDFHARSQVPSAPRVAVHDCR